MAEEQDKQKPKATLIKQRKTEPQESSEPKKVRVVLKRKPKAKVVAKKRPPKKEPAEETSAQPAIDPTPEREEKKAPTRTDAAPVTAMSPEPRPEKKASPEAAPAAATKETTDSGPKKTSITKDPIGVSREAVRRSLSRTEGRAAGRSERSGPARGDSRTARPGERSFDRRPGGPQRPGAPRRPSGPGGNDRSRGPGGSSGGAPFRGGPGGGPGSGPGSGPATGRKPPGKKFFKSKRGRAFEREEHAEEKHLSFGKKKSQQKTNPIPKEIDIMEVISVSELARKMNLKANELIGKLMGMGMMVTINQQIDAETAQILAGEYNCKVNIVSLYDETVIETGEDDSTEMVERPPIVTIMGHVDHGKTKLLDAIRSTDVVAGEHGGITQHIGAYQISRDGHKVTFLDTPGHEAFTLMRLRGAQVTDIVVLVVAANDGVMPQTVEAINHAKAAEVPIIVAVNKIDLPEANPDRVKQQLSEYELMPEDWGGSTIFIEVSALQKEGIDELLEGILLQAELLELKAKYNRNAEGKIIESRIDPGRGTVATVLIERGTLEVGDSFVAGIFPGKVRAMFDDHGTKVTKAEPSMPVEIIGFDGVPDAGDPFQVADNEKHARQIGAKRQELKRVEVAQNVKKITLDNLYDSIQEGQVQELKVVIKGDVHGSVEALKNALERMSTPEVRLVAIHSSAGAINERDVMLAATSNAIVVGFHVRPTPRALAVAEQEKVEIRKYNVIYDAVADIRSAMEGMLAPDLQEETIGSVVVRETFRVPKIGVIAGCYVTDGKVNRNGGIRVFRDGVRIHEGKIDSLKRFKEDVREVETGYECGIGIQNYQDIQEGDEFEVFLVKEVAKKLSDVAEKS